MREELLTKDIIKLARSLKRKIVEITPHYICGCDSQRGYFSIIYINDTVQVDPELYYFGPVNLLTKYNEYLEQKYMYDAYKQKMNYLRATCQFVESNNKLLFSYDDITHQAEYVLPGFNECINGKAKDGASILNLDSTDYFMSTSSTIHPINKTDKANISGYAYNDISYIVKYSILKKAYSIHEYICYLYI